MADEKLQGPELKKMIKLGRKKPMPFAFCPGKKMDEHVVMVDRRKNPSILSKSAKKIGTSPKVAFGTFEVKGKVMEMTCERTVAKMAKTLKMYLKTQKVQVNIVIKDIDGNELESEIEELPEDPDFDQDDADDGVQAQDDGQQQDTVPPAPPPPGVQDQDVGQQQETAPPAPPPPGVQSKDDGDQQDQGNELDAKALASRLKAAQPGVMAVPGETGEKLKKVMAAAVAQIKGGDLYKANQSVTAIEGALAKLGNNTQPSAPPPPPGQPQAQDKDEPAQDTRALAARASALKQAIDGIDEPAKGKLLAALGAAAKQIKGGDLTTADATLTKIEAAANKAMASQGQQQNDDGSEQDGKDSDQGGQSAEAAKWAAAEARLQPHVDKAMAERRGDLDAINRAFNYAKELAADGAYDRALAAAGKVAELLKAAATATTTAAAAEADAAIPDDVVPYVQSRLAWIKTRQGLRSELEGLKSAIDATTADVEGLEDVPSRSGILFDYLNDLDSNLEDTLEKLVETPDGDQREKLKSDARAIIDTYRGVLDTDFFKAVDNNGFVTTNIRGAALDSLQKVSSALAS